MAHLRASKKFGDTIFYNALKLVTLNLTQQSVLNSNTRYYTSSAYLQLIKKNELKLPKNHLGIYIFRPSVAANSIVSDSDRNSNISKLLCMSLLPKRMK